MCLFLFLSLFFLSIQFFQLSSLGLNCPPLSFSQNWSNSKPEFSSPLYLQIRTLLFFVQNLGPLSLSFSLLESVRLCLAYKEQLYKITISPLSFYTHFSPQRPRYGTHVLSGMINKPTPNNILWYTDEYKWWQRPQFFSPPKYVMSQFLQTKSVNIRHW